MRRSSAALVITGALLFVSACSTTDDAVDEDEPVEMPCVDDPTAITVPVVYEAPEDQPTGIDPDALTQALGVLSESAEFGPCLRSGRASIVDLVPWLGGSGQGPVGVVALVSFTEPVDLPRTLKTWRGVGEGNHLPEDELGRPIVEEVSRAYRAQTSSAMVYVSLVGEPGVHAFAKMS